ncbi:hypothetical protein EVAR_36594_1 [Eumeta japonica]|uniref:Uncharacterized protein n=1 Tax=Eumeta variegata TaxID=151549 RepID=A0A4C1XQW6_EUMVA|nr:hypothetical protein EVAR_36594_1 [Eumeta japonica]
MKYYRYFPRTVAVTRKTIRDVNRLRFAGKVGGLLSALTTRRVRRPRSGRLHYGCFTTALQMPSINIICTTIKSKYINLWSPASEPGYRVGRRVARSHLAKYEYRDTASKSSHAITLPATSTNIYFVNGTRKRIANELRSTSSYAHCKFRNATGAAPGAAHVARHGDNIPGDIDATSSMQRHVRRTALPIAR